MTDKRQFAALEWVISEIKETLSQAQHALEAFAVDAEDTTQLRFCLAYIHQVYGTLHMIEFHGAAMLAEEMEHVAQAFVDEKVSHPAEAQEVLMRAILQLPDYLEYIKKIKQDQPVTMLPLLNDLRAVRNAELLSEATLFSPDLSPAYHIHGSRLPVVKTNQQFRIIIAKLRKMYHYAASTIIHQADGDIDESLVYLYKVTQRLMVILQGTHRFALWQIANALVDGLVRKIIPPSAAIKNLLRRLNDELKVLYQGGISLLDHPTNDDIVKNLLYYIACTTDSSPAIDKIKNIYSLDNSLHVGQSNDETDQLANLADVTALRSVAEAIKSEIDGVKDSLDDCFDEEDVDDNLKFIEETLKRVTDTLAILGVASLRQKVNAQINLVKSFRSQKESLTDEQLMHIARNLIEVEDSIDSVLNDNSDSSRTGVNQFDSAQVSVLQESRNGLEKIKDSIVEYIGSNRDSQKLLDVPGYLREVRGGLAMLRLQRPAIILDGCAAYIDRELIRSSDKPQLEQLDHLADVVASVDYYLECELSSQVDDNDSVLDVAENSLSALGYSVKHMMPQDEPSVGSLSADPLSTYEREDLEQIGGEEFIAFDIDTNSLTDNDDNTSTLAPADDLSDIPSETVVASEVTASEVTASEVTAPEVEAVADHLDDDIDEEIVEIFVEEAREVNETIATYFPEWRQDTSNESALTECRRAFHTLKGSGRMVGANAVGELAWSIENMLNRVMDKSISATNVHMVLIEKVHAILPDMVDAFEAREPHCHPVQAAKFMQWAEQLSNGDDSDDILQQVFAESVAPGATTNLTTATDTSEQPESTEQIEQIVEPAAGLVEVSGEPIDDVDLQLLEIFSSETESHLEVVKEYIDDMLKASPAFEPPSDALQAALHTLRGSAHMAEVMSIAELTSPLESFTKELRSYQVNINDDILQLLQDAAAYTESALDHIGKGQKPEIPKLDMFKARVAELHERTLTPIIRKIEQSSNQKTVDPDLLESIMMKHMDLLIDMDLHLAKWQAEGASVEDWSGVVGELNHLKQGAERASLPSMYIIAQELATVYERLRDGKLLPEPIIFEVLLDAHNQLLTSVDAVAAGQNLPELPDGLVDRVRALQYLTPQSAIDVVKEAAAEAELEAQIEADIEAQSDDILDIDAIPVELEEVELDDAENEELYEGSHEERVQLEEPISEELVVGEIEAPSEPETFIHEPIIATSEPVTDDDDVDEEIIEIFLEEADELIEEIDEAVLDWEEDPGQTHSNEQLQRSLHTLKGGARLAGLMELGDLAHNFEAYIIEYGNSNIEDQFFAQLHLYQDQVIKSVDHVRAGEPVPASLVDVDASASSVETIEVVGVEVVPEPVESATESIVEIVDDEYAIDDALVADSQGGALEELVETLDAQEAEPEQGAIEPVIDDTPEVIEPVPSEPSEQPGINVVPFTRKSSEFIAAQEASSAKSRAAPQEVVKVPAEIMEDLVNLAGETSISRARMEEQISDISFSLDEMGSTVQRLQEQLRRLDIETEAQVLFRQEQMVSEQGEFDPLEMDRYSHLQQLSRSLIESASDLMDLKSTLVDKTRDTETVLIQQSRVNTELQENLMRSRMVPFSRMVPRLRRIVRQVATELDKSVNFVYEDTEGELDRSMLERMIPPFEHMLRNAIDHGIESKEDRLKSGKPAVGNISLSLGREGGDVLIFLRDDGAGVELDKVRRKAIERNLMTPDAELSDKEVLQFILHAGFSTAETVTQISGRGVGMDVVYSEIKQLGGNMKIESETGKGTSFTIRLPFTVSVNRALMVMIGDDRYAVPLNAIEGIVRISPYELEHYYSNPDSRFEYAGEHYQVRYLGSMVNDTLRPKLEGQMLPLPVLLIRSSDHIVALQVDQLQGSREIVVKSLGAQFANVQGLAGATIMGDGHVVVILDLHAIIRQSFALNTSDVSLLEMMPRPDEKPISSLVMVVDDSVTVRKVTTRLLEREGFEVITAKDGLDAMAVLLDYKPDLMLLDIEMPRMDGFEVAKNVRSSEIHSELPIIMITSRTGNKHRQRGLSLGVNDYMGKPYQEDMLLEKIRELISISQSVES